MSEQHRREYWARIHRAQDYIEQHLGEALTLEGIAKVACFSPFHFHRIYAAATGETLHRFILRLRLERAASLLCGLPDHTVTGIALDCGFSSSSSFARAFKNEFGVSASEMRKNRQLLRKGGEAASSTAGYGDAIAAGKPGRRTMMMAKKTKQPIEVQVRDLPERTLAYVRHVGPYAGNAALFQGLWGRLCAWAGPRDLLGRPGAEMISIYHDDPGITDEGKLRVSVGVTVPPGTAAGGEVNLLPIPAGRYVVARFELDATEFADAWSYVMGEWLPGSGYQCDDRPHYEVCLNNPQTSPEGRFLTEICVPIKPL